MKKVLLAAAAVGLLAGAARAEQAPVARRIDARTVVDPQTMAGRTAARQRLLDLGEDAESWSVPAQSLYRNGRSRRAGSLTRFTRIAGMFMGRVSALSVGPFKVCIELDIR